MTLTSLIHKVNEEKPNSFTTAKQVEFINEIEADVADQLNISEVPVYEDTEDGRGSTLLAPAPYDRLYVSYLKAQIDYANEEYESFQNNQLQHVQDFKDFTDWVVRTKQVAEEDNPMPSRFTNTF